TVDYEDGPRRGGVRGTCFFVFLEDQRLGKDGGFVYLVTNRHIAAPREDKANGRKFQVLRTSVRLNLKNRQTGEGSEEGILPLGDHLKWYFPPDEAVDLAVMPLVPDTERYDVAWIPSSLFATKDLLAAESIAEGDKVLFTGFFSQFPGRIRIEPIVRE